ncbi:MAG: UDP-N-acetylmuramoyl-L-alanyl-D-glutamate--2,6-diaminopimelate ligase [Bacteroidota bacterium]
MKLKTLLTGVPTLEIKGELDKEIGDFSADSREIEKGHLFVALPGTQVDGHAFIDKAIAKGAGAILCEKLPAQQPEGVTFIRVEVSHRELARIAANFYGNPAQKLKLVGITGTNGKTTSATLLYHLFTSLGLTSGLVSTIGNKIGRESIPATHTTPDPKQLHHLFAQMWEAGCEYCFMEVSSHALVQHRVFGIPFQVAMFTNITHDHLDYHGTFQEYIKAKKLLFDHLPTGATALINVDDRRGKVMVQNTRGKVKTFGLKRMADYKARLLENSFDGLLMEIDGEEVWFRLHGSFNAYNLLMVYGAALELEEEKEDVLKAMSKMGGVAGRFEVFHFEGQRIGIVDYAHTPDALKNVLSTIQDINQTRGKVITVVGCGGNRDQAKRPKMAAIALDYSDQVILTSDNPRNEDPESILDMMYEGVPAALRRKVLRIENRREAIRTASQLAQNQDIILIAGKGHETYQEVKGVKYPFDDRQVLQEAFG